jgi:hypothetical protein
MSALHTADTNSFEEKGKSEHQEYAQSNVVNHADDPALQVSPEFSKKTMQVVALLFSALSFSPIFRSSRRLLSLDSR